MRLRQSKNEDSWLPILLAICFGFMSGLFLAAITNRIIEFFFFCTFVGSVFAGIATLVILLIYGKDAIDENLKSKKDKSKIIFLSCSLSILLTFSFLATVPLNVDRSFSVWLLNQMSKSQVSVSRLDLEKKAQEFFNPQGGEISRRLDEQLRLGTVELNADYLLLTQRGEFQVRTHRFIQWFFGLNLKYTG